MGLTENPTNLPQKQAFQRCRVGGRVRRRPRTRRCLLKGCEQCYRPRQASQRYCREECQEAARAWSRWKAQERYRGTEGGREKRRGQGQRYRERVRTRRAQRGEAPETAARVIPAQFFFGHLRPAGMLREIRAEPAGAGASLGAGTAMAGGWAERPRHGVRFPGRRRAARSGCERRDEEMVLKY